MVFIWKTQMEEISYLVFHIIPIVNGLLSFQPKWNLGLISIFLEGRRKYGINSNGFSTFHLKIQKSYLNSNEETSISVNKIIVIPTTHLTLPSPNGDLKILIATKLPLAFSHTGIAVCTQQTVMLSDTKDIFKK